MGDFPEQRHGAWNEPGGGGGPPWMDWLFGLHFQAASYRTEASHLGGGGEP